MTSPGTTFKALLLICMLLAVTAQEASSQAAVAQAAATEAAAVQAASVPEDSTASGGTKGASWTAPGGSATAPPPTGSAQKPPTGPAPPGTTQTPAPGSSSGSVGGAAAGSGATTGADTVPTDSVASETHGYSNKYHNWYTGGQKYYSSNYNKNDGGGCNKDCNQNNCNCQCPTNCPCPQCNYECKNCRCTGCTCPTDCACTLNLVWRRPTWNKPMNPGQRWEESSTCPAGQRLLNCICSVVWPSDVLPIGTELDPWDSPTTCTCSWRNLGDATTVAGLVMQYACSA